MTYRIYIAREWSCSPLGGPAVSYPPGGYRVPEDMSDYLAERCLRAGRGRIVQDAPEPAPPPAKGARRIRAIRQAPQNKSDVPTGEVP